MKRLTQTLSMLVLVTLLVACGNVENSPEYTTIISQLPEEFTFDEILLLFNESSINENDNEVDDVLYDFSCQNQTRPSEPEMSAFGRQVTEDFLMQFPTIFNNHGLSMWGYTLLNVPVSFANERVYRTIPIQRGEEIEDGRFRVWDSGEWVYTYERLFELGWLMGDIQTNTQGLSWVEAEDIIITDEVPDVFYRQNGFFYDSNLNRIVEANWLLGYNQFATHFTLWNFDNSGIPVNEIFYWGNSGSGSTHRSLFRFDGYEFLRINYDWDYIFSLHSMGSYKYTPYLDSDGNLVLFVSSGTRNAIIHDVSADAGYYHVTFEGTQAISQRIVTLHVDVDNRWRYGSWTNHITGETGIFADEINFFTSYGWYESEMRSIARETCETRCIHYLPSTDIPLTRLHPLEELRDEMDTIVRTRFLYDRY